MPEIAPWHDISETFEHDKLNCYIVLLDVKPEDAISNDMVYLVNLYHVYVDHIQFAND